MSDFTHLCVHSYYSLLSALPSIEALTERASQDGLTSLALTDTNALYGAVSFARSCRASNIQPIIGMTISIAPPEDLNFTNSHDHICGELTLLATGVDGYRSLCKLSSLLQAYPDRETRLAKGINLDDLRDNHHGLICLSGGRKGWLDRALRAQDEQGAFRFTTHLATIFGSDNVYLSLELHRPQDNAIAHQICSIGHRLGLLTVAVQPVYCLSAQDTPLLELLTAIQHHAKLKEVSAHFLPNEGDSLINLHWLSPSEMNDHFVNFPDALLHSKEISDRCAYALPNGKLIWPAIDLPGGQTTDQKLAELSQIGLSQKYGSESNSIITERLLKELKAIEFYGFAPLFLVVADIVRYARQTGIPVSSRGSVANSLVAFCAGITNVDPIANDLLFERFLSPARADIPDIDLDFCSRRRDEVLDYVRSTYGYDHVALVGTICTMHLTSAVRETAKVYGLDEDQINSLVKKLPRYHHDPRRQDQRTIQDVLSEIKEAKLAEIVEQASHLVGLPHHLGVHPGGVVIAPGPLTDTLPLQYATKGFLITQFDFRYIEELGLPKLDLLGVSALTVLSDAATLVRQHYDKTFDLEMIPIDDPDTQKLLCSGETIGVFQCESQGARSTLMKLKARTIRDLAVANAFFKPGPSTGGMARSFVRRYRGEETVTYLHPSLEPVLGVTKGVIIFQEQILRLAREIAGLSWEQAGHLRRGMSKMKSGEMTQIEEAFKKGSQRPPPDGPGLTSQQALQLWNQVSAFSGYGFNQGHATAYAAVSYRMAYLKSHWPAAYLCARLANWGGFHHPAVYMVEALRLGIDIRSPHINFSNADFTLSWEDEKPILWMGLSQIRDLRRNAIKMIMMQRRNSTFTSLRDLLIRVSLQSKEVVHLIQCGSLDGLGKNRAAILTEFSEIGKADNVLQLSLFGNEQSKFSDVTPETLTQRLSWEKQLLGYPVSAMKNPRYLIKDHKADYLDLNLLSKSQGNLVTVGGMRIPGWTGGDGFYLWDGNSWVVARGSETSAIPKSWESLVAQGRWKVDEWGYSWFQIEDMRIDN